MSNRTDKYIDQLRHAIQTQDREIDKLEARVIELLDKLAKARELGLHWQKEAELGPTKERIAELEAKVAWLTRVVEDELL